MTTKVTVDAHAGWPVQVEAEDKFLNGEITNSILGIVQPGEVRDFYVFDTRKITVIELKKDS